jgi:hypothetical protein
VLLRTGSSLFCSPSVLLWPPILYRTTGIPVSNVILAVTSVPAGGTVLTGAQTFALDISLYCQIVATKGVNLLAPCMTTLLLSADNGVSYCPVEAKRGRADSTNSFIHFDLADYADFDRGMLQYYLGASATPAAVGVASKGFHGPWTHYQVMFSGNTGAAVTATVLADGGASGGGSGSVTAVTAGAGLTGGTITTSGTIALANPTVSAIGGVQAIVAVAHQWITSITTSGVPVLAQPAFTDVSGTATAAQLPTTGLTVTQHIAAVIVPTGTSGTITMNLALGDWQVPAQCTAAFTLALSNPTVGQTFRVILTQAASGGPFAVTWFSGITWVGSPYTAPTMPATAGALLEAVFECTGTGVYIGHWLGNSNS